MPEKQALGLTMQISQEYIDNLAAEMVRESLMKTLNGEDRFFRELVKEILNTKVDESGRPCNYSSSIPYIQYLINKVIREEITGTLQEILNESRPQIREKIRKELMKKDMVNKVFNAFMETVMDATENNYRTNFEINFNKARDY